MTGTTKSDITRSAQSLESDNRAVLSLVGDELSCELILAVLGADYRVTIASTPREAERLLVSLDYRLVIVTNLGILPKQAVSVIPINHVYPVLFLSGYFDRQLQEECARKRIRHMALPFAVAELRQAVVDALDERTAFGRSRPDAEPVRDRSEPEGAGAPKQSTRGVHPRR